MLTRDEIINSYSSGQISESAMVDLLVSNINNWDLEDIKELKELIFELYQWRDNADQLIDMADLPSCLVPPHIPTSYPIWAMDQRGFCLVGEEANSIEYIKEIEYWYKSK